MTPPKKLSAPAAQTVALKGLTLTAKTPRQKKERKERLSPQERAKVRATKLSDRLNKQIAKFHERERKTQARITAASERFTARAHKTQARIKALLDFAAIDPTIAKKEKARVAAMKRAEKLEEKLMELRKVIES